jgi:hypothetical protein
VRKSRRRIPLQLVSGNKGLAEFVIKRVDELGKRVIGKKQEPQYFRGRDAEDYVLARW